MVYETILAKKVNPVKAIAVSFLVIILIGTVLLMMPFSSREHKATTFPDALFTATSATTVTGLVVKDTHDYYSPTGHIIILALIQIGGLGYMTLMSFLFIFGRNMKLAGGVYLQESMNLPSIGDVYKFARNTAAFVMLFELLGAFALFLTWKGSMGISAAIKYGAFHSIAAFNNSGFDLFGGFNSLASQATNVGVNLTIMLLTITGGIGFIVMNELIQKLKNRRQKLSTHTKLVLATTAILILAGTAAFFALEKNNAITNLSLPQQIMASAFQSVNARSSGFNTVPFGGLRTATMLLLAALMFIGSSPGGTGGGIKTTTAAIAIKSLIAFARGKTDVELFDRRLSSGALVKAFATISAAAILVIVASAAISVIEPVPYEKILFETVSAFGTVGLSTGITQQLALASRLILIGVMFIGRIGPLAMLHLALAQKRTQLVRLPEEDVPVG